MLARAITLVESTLRDDQNLAGEILDAIIPHTGNSLRIGITGSPGVGKSTFIESFGKAITDSGKKIAVLTVDPSSQVTRGSILGDKTRMEELGKNPMAFIRTTPSGQTLGGIAGHTRETILLCEAAGFEIIVIETVGVGQSEFSVKSMVDFFLLLMLAGSGDDLQGIKKGIIEMADAIAVTKADGENIKRAHATMADFQQALHLLQPQSSEWTPKVVTCSAIHSKGIVDIWNMIQQFKKQMETTHLYEINRQNQQSFWFDEHFRNLLAMDHLKFPAVQSARDALKTLVQSKKISPRKAAQELLDKYHKAVSGKL